MAFTSAAALRKSLARGDRGGVFFLLGEEPYLIEECAQTLIGAHLDPSTRDFNLDQLRGTNLDIENVASICQTPPMMSEWRVVVVRDAQALAANAKTRSAIEALAIQRVPGLALIITAHLDARKLAKVWQNIQKKATTLRFDTLSTGDLPDWLAERAEEIGSGIEPAAARALAAAAGPELGRLAQELAKLSDFVGDRGVITVDDVEKLVGYIPRHNRWDWFDTVAEARFADARSVLDVVLDNENAVGLVIGLGAQLLRVGIAAAGGQNALGELLPPNQRWLAARIAKQARRWSVANVDAALSDLLRADRLLKSSSLTDHQVIEELLLRMQSRQAAAA